MKNNNDLERLYKEISGKDFIDALDDDKQKLISGLVAMYLRYRNANDFESMLKERKIVKQLRTMMKNAWLRSIIEKELVSRHTSLKRIPELIPSEHN